MKYQALGQAKRGVGFRHSICNAPRIQRKLEKEQFIGSLRRRSYVQIYLAGYIWPSRYSGTASEGDPAVASTILTRLNYYNFLTLVTRQVAALSSVTPTTISPIWAESSTLHFQLSFQVPSAQPAICGIQREAVIIIICIKSLEISDVVPSKFISLYHTHQKETECPKFHLQLTS